MDVNDWRVLVTVLGLVLFVALWVWAWSRKRRSAFDEAARLPFAGDHASDDADGEGPAATAAKNATPTRDRRVS
jgi:cytochrome c oxidase cbb3-type subunit IV